MLSIILAVQDLGGGPFKLRTDPPPKEWKTEKINKGLPYHWENGTVHVLAWEVIEDKSDHGSSKTTQILVLKRYDQPTEQGKYRWVLALLYHYPKDKNRTWFKHMLHIPPVRPGKKMPKLTNAQVFGHELYKDLPTDQQIQVFLYESGWTPQVGPSQALTLDKGKVVTIHYMTTVVAGGIDPKLWRTVFGRGVPTKLFPELKRGISSKE